MYVLKILHVKQRQKYGLICLVIMQYKEVKMLHILHFGRNNIHVNMFKKNNNMFMKQIPPGAKFRIMHITKKNSMVVKQIECQ